jgi:hypothetical protein
MKKTTTGPIKPVDKLSKNQFLEVRKVNPYLVEKNTRLCPNAYLYHQNQERIYNEIYGANEFACCPQWSINMEKLDSEPGYFGEAKAICEELGLVPLMTFNHPYSKEIICQFYATVVFEVNENGDRSLTWMTKEHVMKATWCAEPRMTTDQRRRRFPDQT